MVVCSMERMAKLAMRRKRLKDVLDVLLVLFFFVGSVDGINTDVTKSNCIGNYYAWPECEDNPDGYGCLCGPGFQWNTNLCFSTAVNSRLEFNQIKGMPQNGYTTLVERTFPELKAFTITFWMRVPNGKHPGTILSYSVGNEPNRQNLLKIVSGPSILFTLFGDTKDTMYRPNEDIWVHYGFSWTSYDGSWAIYANGARLAMTYKTRIKPMILRQGGNFILGRTSFRDTNTTYFIGDLSHVQIWDYFMNDSDINEIYKDCTFSQCGNAVQWVEFRAGTHGNMKMKWPSGILEEQDCFTKDDAARSCDKYCSIVIGAQCNEEIVENMLWPRTPAEKNISIPCPGRVDEHGNATAYAYRYCRNAIENDGRWDSPIIDECISPEQLQLKQKFQKFLDADNMDENRIFELGGELLNHTKTMYYGNPMDIAAEIDTLSLLIQAQGLPLTDVEWSPMMMRFKQAQPFYPTFQETQKFAELTGAVINSLLDAKNDIGWESVQPPGAEGDNVIHAMEKFVSLISKSLMYHVKRGDISRDEASFSALYKNIAMKIKIYKTDNFLGYAFPDQTDVYTVQVPEKYGTLALPREALMDANVSLPDSFGISSVMFMNMARLLPNHEKKSKEDNVNSALFSLHLHFDDQDVVDVQNLSSPLKVHLPYLNDFNVSNPECVTLRHARHGHRLKASQWSWEKDGCYVIKNGSSFATCACHSFGVFAVLTDMYNDDWDKGERPPQLMAAPSYIGCTVSALLCLVSALALIYLRTSSPTAAIHKNFAVSVMLSQVVFMMGINQLGNMTVCHAFAIMFHYTFLASFSWLMNEAFNLYIVITYAAHSHGNAVESGSSWRYYILGWVVPGALVGAIVGSHSDVYYAQDMCWISWDYIWLFLGPAIAIVCVTTLVLIFTAKEHHESSYAKADKTNKTIATHTKALWTQVILLSVVWCFAFLSLKMRGPILKYLYALLNCLQGSFFVVFYFLLNEEVRAVYKYRRKKKTLAMHGYDASPTHSLHSIDSINSEQPIMEMHKNEESTPTGVAGPSPESSHSSSSTNTPQKQEQRQRRGKLVRYKTEYGTGEDCEEMITSV